MSNYQPHLQVRQLQHTSAQKAVLPVKEFIKCLGCRTDASGHAKRDFEDKCHLMESAIASRHALWSTKGTSRSDRIYLQHRVGESSICWSAALWNLSVRDMKKVRGIMLKAHKHHLRLARILGTTDAKYAKEQCKMISGIRETLRLPTIEHAILRQQYRWAGHVARMARQDSSRVTGMVLKYLCRQELSTRMFLAGTEDHPGQFFFHGWETRFSQYFDSRGVIWTDIAQNRRLWNSRCSEWCNFRAGCH